MPGVVNALKSASSTAWYGTGDMTKPTSGRAVSDPWYTLAPVAAFTSWNVWLRTASSPKLPMK